MQQEKPSTSEKLCKGKNKLDNIKLCFWQEKCGDLLKVQYQLLRVKYSLEHIFIFYKKNNVIMFINIRTTLDKFHSTSINGLNIGRQINWIWLLVPVLVARHFHMVKLKILAQLLYTLVYGIYQTQQQVQYQLPLSDKTN